MHPIKSLAAGLIAMLLASSCRANTINYRLTIVSSSGGHENTSSGVIETIWFPQPSSGLVQGRHWQVEICGQAIPLNFGQDGTAYVLLTGPPVPKRGDPAGDVYYPRAPEQLLMSAFGQDSVGTMTSEELQSAAHRLGKWNIPLPNLPMLVGFADPANPATVFRIDPLHLPAGFGSGAMLKSATLEITADRASVGLSRTLVWLKRYRGKFLSGKTSATDGFAGSLPASLFEQGQIE